MKILKTDSDTDLVVTTPVKCGCSCQKDIEDLTNLVHDMEPMYSQVLEYGFLERIEQTENSLLDYNLVILELKNSIVTTDRIVIALEETTNDLENHFNEVERDVTDLEKETSDILDSLEEMKTERDDMLVKLNRIFPSIFSEDSP